MKYILLLVLMLVGLLMHFELDISLKEEGYLLRYFNSINSEQLLADPQEPLSIRLSQSREAVVANESTRAVRVEQAVIQEPVMGRLPVNTSSQEDIVARVTDVIDGDTIEVLLGGETQTVRYIGVNTPEQGEVCYKNATAENRKLVLNKVVTLYSDETDKDRYGRLLRYVFVGDMLVERELVARGFAEVVLYRSDDDHYNEFNELESRASDAGLGCHPTGIFDDSSRVR